MANTLATNTQGTAAATLLSVDHLSKSFPEPGKSTTLSVLKDVTISMREGEFVALLGRSGSGKSTLLRAVAGLIPPTKGAIELHGEKVTGPSPHVAMVFQSFALLPWLTVQENVELGLRARGVPLAERRERALSIIDMVGLDGFETAYPKELSGGMQQRVGFARAFAVRPDLLLMDEPFSALDVLTAENLRGEIARLWSDGAFPAKSVLMVTHNIEEAVLLADRILILGSNPGHIRGEVVTRLPRPRDRTRPDFKAIVGQIYAAMLNPEIEIGTVTPTEIARYAPLPHARAGGISGLLEVLVEEGGEGDAAGLAHSLRLEVDDLLPILDAAAQLGFAELQDGRVLVTEAGRAFARADALTSKEIFRAHVLEHAPLVQTVVEVMRSRPRRVMRRDFMLDILDEHYPVEEAERQFATAVDWGRYAELFEYDADDGLLRLT